MNRFSLNVQLALILALAMIASLMVVVVVDRVNDLERTENDYYGTTDALALQLLQLQSELSPQEFEIALRVAQHPSNWLYFGPWEGLHPLDTRDEDWEQSLLGLRVLAGTPVSDIRVATRHFDFAPPVGTRRTPVREGPEALSLGNRPRMMLRPPPPNGEPRPWVQHPIVDGVPMNGWADPVPSNPDRRGLPTTIYTVAFQPEGGEQWLVVYRVVRPPPLGGTLSIATYALVAGVVLAGLAMIVGRRVMAPFHRVAQHSELLGRGEQPPAVPVKGPKDVREIVSAFNSMNARVSQATDYQIGLLRSLGHDLKGPLAAVGRLVRGVGPEDTRAQIETRLERVQSIVGDIMSFSRAVMRDGELEVADVAAMLEAVVHEQADLGADAEVDAPDRVLLLCRANAMERCLRNLVENGVKYGKTIRARIFTEGDEAVIQIDDTGPGIPAEEIEDAFQPFHRLADDEHGSGLGLAIARTIVIDQGGSLSLRNREEGGLRAELRLPVSRDEVGKRAA